MSEILPLRAHSDVVAEPVPFIDLVSQNASIAEAVQDKVAQVFASQHFVLGDEVAEFEFEVASYCDSREAIGCASGTDALLLALMALDLKPGDEVITSPYTFFATGGAIYRSGAVPVFVDIQPDCFNIDPAAVEAAITPKTRAILPVHLYGQCADMEPLWRIAVQHGLAIIEDAAQAIGSELMGRRAGVLGTMGCFSFFPTKNLGGAGDGGLITTDDADLAARLRRLRVHGDAGGYHHLEVGLNSRLDALQAAVLRVKLPHLDSWTEARRNNASQYQTLFEEYGLLDAIETPAVVTGRKHIYNQYCIRVKDGRRDEVKAKLHEQQVGCAIYYPIPLHLQPCFEYLGYEAGSLPESERAAAETLALPIFSELTAQQLERVVQAISIALGRSGEKTAPISIPAAQFAAMETQTRAKAG
ncbi:Aminotransferase [Symmachiella dynata]|uniref:Aminotransferase n=1 Tax=Symmachiella dynata TaxID=2527995 RepID=A0A517ZNS9_9PLAN|nr:DegT/DnrJ/EryC1/StrS family aminotransferase [Symmachiella dynata]QDU44133.1 Aminotransferase [Symmachiella dynata]